MRTQPSTVEVDEEALLGRDSIRGADDIEIGAPADDARRFDFRSKFHISGITAFKTGLTLRD
jgi:hypothetical protein